MENAADAIKIAFGIFVFVLALTLAISVVGQARATSEVVFHSNDKTEFYQYATEENVEHSKDRIVGIETVIPTIHRYAKEQFAVTIFDKLGNPIVRYDLWTEGFMANWNDTVKHYKRTGKDENYEQVRERLRVVQEVVLKTLNIPVKEFNIEEMIDRLYSVRSSTNTSITIGAPWIGDNEKIFQRIKADMTGSEYTINNITYNSKDLSPDKKRNLKNYKNSKFIEKYLEVTTSGTIIIDAGDSLETIKGNKKLEIIYILQE